MQHHVLEEQKPQIHTFKNLKTPISLFCSVFTAPNCMIPRIPSLKIQNIQITNKLMSFFLSLLIYSPPDISPFSSSPYPQLAQISWTLLLHFILLCSREVKVTLKQAYVALRGLLPPSCLSVSPSVCPHATTRLPLDGF
jgi:hypothetical protein